MKYDWKECFQRGIAPQLSTLGLRALRQSLVTDDPRVIQGQTTMPAALSHRDRPVEAACVIGFCGWMGDKVDKVGDLNGYFANVCSKADEALAEFAAVLSFLNFVDETPRAKMRTLLIAEIDIALDSRRAPAHRRGDPRYVRDRRERGER